MINLTKNEEQLTSELMGKISLAKDSNDMKGSVINLSKTVINLSKEKGFDLTGLTSQVVLVLDHSGSMDRDYANGAVQDVVTKMVPLGLTFDDNGEIEVFKFDNIAEQIKESLNIRNYENYVKKYVYRTNDMGGTEYARPLELIYKDYCGAEKSTGFFGKLFGKKASTGSITGVTSEQTPVFVIFITDGDNSDEYDTNRALDKLKENNVFVQFIGISNSKFKYLKDVAKNYNNASFVKFNDISKMNSDDEIYAKILTDFAEYLASRK